MANDYFRFKQFTVMQRNTAMRVGTDGVLLGAWADVSGATEALDIGTGTGIIAIMLAQRNSVLRIDAVELDKDSADEARMNASNSPWKERITVYHLSFMQYLQDTDKSFDLIVSNPPYFNRSLKPSDRRREIARHSESLPYDQLLWGIADLLKSNGCFCGVFPYVEGSVFIAQAAARGLYCTQRVNVYSKPGNSPLRVLIRLEKRRLPMVETDMAIHSADGSYTKEYRSLTADFYLKF